VAESTADKPQLPKFELPNIRSSLILKPMKLYLARHGRTNYNDLGLCNADPAVDVHLTPTGTAQAEVLASQLRLVHFDVIFVSELRRTQQTAGIVNAFHNTRIEVDARLNDGRTGFEGEPVQEFIKALDATDNRWTARFGDGESVEDIKKRVADFIDELRTKDYESVLIVTSQWIVQAIVTIVKGISNEEAWKLEVGQGSCLELEIN
jgi:alpha-ribazole phosphatase